jgi:hypothetical protein
MGFGLGLIFKDVVLDYGRLQPLLQLLSQGPANFISSPLAGELQYLGTILSVQIGLYPSPYSQEERDRALPPVIPGTPPDTFEGIIFEAPPPERVTGLMDIDAFDFVSSTGPADGGWRYQNFDNYADIL